ncbi:MAG: helix-turn-helix domain-containing protein [bacterium]|nr:helix-turn-helix domain-containing protein [bacterium]
MTAAGFRTRKIKRADQTIGDSLKSARIHKKCSIEAVEEATHIRAKFLLALESDAWEQLPSEVYGRGYLMRYAQFLGLSEATITSLYEKERMLLAHKCAKAQAELAPTRSFSLPRWFITPKLVSYTLAAVLVLVLGGYLTVQVNKFAAVPVLQIAEPISADESPLSAVLVKDKQVTITGKTSVGAELKINNEPVLVSSDGVFHQTIELTRGENIIQLKATNKSGAEKLELMRLVAEY